MYKNNYKILENVIKDLRKCSREDINFVDNSYELYNSNTLLIFPTNNEPCKVYMATGSEVKIYENDLILSENLILGNPKNVILSNLTDLETITQKASMEVKKRIHFDYSMSEYYNEEALKEPNCG